MKDRGRERARRRGRCLVWTVLLLLLAGGALGRALRRDPTPRILELRGELTLVREDVPTTAIDTAGDPLIDQDVLLGSTGGLAVELSVRRPAGAATPRPTLLLLGGQRTGRRAAQLVPDTHGMVVAAMSYPTRVERIEGIGDALEARRAILATPAAVMLCADYLCGLPYVDPARLELAGVSLGSQFVCVAGALDERFARVWSIHGGGAPARLLEAALERELPFAAARKPAARLIEALAHGRVLAPEDWVGQIAPRPFVMINASDDDAMPRECIDVLYAAARGPKELVWITGGHINRRKQDEIVRLCELVIERMK